MRRNTTIEPRSASAGFVHATATWPLPAVTVDAVTFPGDRLSIVTVVPPVSLPACPPVPVQLLTSAVTAYVEPTGAGMFAWLFGVIRTLYCVLVVIAVMLVESAMAGVSLAGSATEP